MPVSRYISGISLGLAIVAFLLGMYGFSTAFPDRSWDTNVVNTWRLYLVDYDLGEDYAPLEKIPWPLAVARLLAPISLILGAAWALLCAIGDAGNRILLKFATGHVVIAGSGSLLGRLCRDEGTLCRRVVAIVPTIDEVQSRRLARRRIAFVVGEINDPRTLERAKAHRATHLVSLADRDTDNAHCIIEAIRLAGEKRSAPEPLHCYAHVVDRRLRAAFNENATFQNTTDRAEIYLFSQFEATARHALLDYPLEVDTGGSVHPRPRLILLGCGDEARAFFLHAARMAHFGTLEKLPITWLAVDAATLATSIEHQFPFYRNAVDCEFVDVLTEGPESYAIALSEEAPPPGDAFSTIVCALDSDSDNFILAQYLQSAIGSPQTCRILVHAIGDSDVAQLIQTLDKEGTPETRAIGQPELVGSWKAITQSDLEPTARAIHEHYIEGELSRLKGNAVENPSLVSWAKLPELKRDQNRFQGDHLPVKLRAIGLDMSVRHDSDQLTEALEKNRDRLAEMEHRRWNAAQWLAGFKHGEPRNDDKKIHPSLKDWDALSPAEQAKDFEAIDAIPAILKRVQAQPPGDG